MAGLEPQMILKGRPIYASLILTEAKTEEVPRAWKERLFSWPWRPLKTHKFVTTQVASRDVVCLHGKLFAHPDLIEEIKAAIDKQGERQ